MNILILSASTGGGHMRASRAIEGYMDEYDKDNNVKIVDSILYISKVLNKAITEGYIYLATKTPKIYGKLYELTNKEERWVSFVSRFNYLFAKKLLPLIDEFKPDVIITTHPFPTEMVSILKEKEFINVPLACIMTDYAPHKAWVTKKVDAYIVSNDDMVEEMKRIGVREEVIYPFGIPIEQVFFEHKDRESVLNEMELNPKLPTILMMAGSFGVTNIFKIYEDIINIDMDFQLIVITGKNQKLYDEFDKIVDNSKKRTKLIYFTNEVNKFMQAADMIITKPGGLTITEALASNKPMAIFDAIPGQEEENAEFLINHNMAIKIGNNKSCSEIIEELLINKEKLNNMQEACRAFNKSDSSKNICMLINELVENGKK